jgi:hypothetical protein
VTHIYVICWDMPITIYHRCSWVNRPFPLCVKFWSRYAWTKISSQLERASLYHIILGFCSPKNNSAFLPFGRRFVQNLKVLESLWIWKQISKTLKFLLKFWKSLNSFCFILGYFLKLVGLLFYAITLKNEKFVEIILFKAVWNQVVI